MFLLGVRTSDAFLLVSILNASFSRVKIIAVRPCIKRELFWKLLLLSSSMLSYLFDKGIILSIVAPNFFRKISGGIYITIILLILLPLYRALGSC